jgi:hypothetical protein
MLASLDRWSEVAYFLLLRLLAPVFARDFFVDRLDALVVLALSFATARA